MLRLYFVWEGKNICNKVKYFFFHFAIFTLSQVSHIKIMGAFTSNYFNETPCGPAAMVANTSDDSFCCRLAEAQI